MTYLHLYSRAANATQGRHLGGWEYACDIISQAQQKTKTLRKLCCTSSLQRMRGTPQKVSTEVHKSCDPVKPLTFENSAHFENVSAYRPWGCTFGPLLPPGWFSAARTPAATYDCVLPDHHLPHHYQPFLTLGCQIGTALALGLLLRLRMLALEPLQRILRLRR